MASEADPAPAEYRHPKCYANTRGGCSTKISGEHYLSHGLIRLFSFDDPDFLIGHSNGLGVRRPVQPKAFKANVLCQRHNTALSPADDAAIAFASFLRKIAFQFHAGDGTWESAEAITISGDDLQRWVLKMFLTHAAVGAFQFDGTQVDTPIPEDAIDLLLDRSPWPRTWGLCLHGDASNDMLRMDPFSSDVLTNWWGFVPFLATGNQALVGGVAELSGVGLGLSLFNQGREVGALNDIRHPLRGSVQRPRSLAWVIAGLEKRIDLTWTDCWEHKTLTWTLE